MMISNIYSFIVIEVATPLAILSIVVGGVMILLSAGNPNIQGTGKKILVSAIIGLVLVFASWAIINTVLTILGYKDVAHWNTLGG